MNTRKRSSEETRTHVGWAVPGALAEPEEIVRVRPDVRVGEDLVRGLGGEVGLRRVPERREIEVVVGGCEGELDGAQLRVPGDVRRVVVAASIRGGRVSDGSGQGEKDRDAHFHRRCAGAGRRALAADVFRFAQPGDVCGERRRRARSRAGELAVSEPAGARRVAQEELVLWVEQRQVVLVGVEC